MTNETAFGAGGGSLHLDHVSKTYGTVRAVDDVDISLARGEFLTLLGPSGSGKTTLLMMIAGFVSPTSGEIRLDGRTITTVPPERRDFGMVFQGYALFPHLSVERNVAFPLEVRRTPKAETAQRVRQALDLVQLAPLAQRLPRQLSGGQQQRVALARALVFTPHLLLLDEPLSALDRKLRAEVQLELKDLHRRLGLTFIYVTHDQEEALSMSDRIAVLRDGRLVQQDGPAALYERPRTRFVADFLGKSNFLRGRIEGAERDGFVYRCGSARFVQAGAAGEPGSEVMLALRPEKIEVVHEGSAVANRVSGTVVNWSYAGAAFHVVLETADAGQMSLTVPAWRLGTPPATGQTMTVGWHADASIPVESD